MLVSIVTPSFNQAKYLPDLIQSVKAQNYRPIEHIIIDGASSDDTLTLLKMYERDSAGIDVKWSSEKDRGQAHAINKGFELAKGEIVGWINSDDVYFHKDVMGHVVEAFQLHPDVDVIHGDVAKIAADNLISIVWCIPEFNYERMSVDGKVSQPTVFFRRRVIEENQLCENLLALDFEFWIRLGQRYKFMHLDDILAGDRNQPERISVVRSDQLHASHTAVVEKYFPDIPLWRKNWYRVSSLPVRVFYRMRGMRKYLKARERPGNLAFNARFDPLPILMKRQLFTRIANLPLNK